MHFSITEEYLQIPAYPDVLVSSKFPSLNNENEDLPTIQDTSLFSNFFSFYWSEDGLFSFLQFSCLPAHDVSSRRPFYFSFFNLSIELLAPLTSLFMLVWCVFNHHWHLFFLLSCDWSCFKVVSYFTKYFWHYC